MPLVHQPVAQMQLPEGFGIGSTQRHGEQQGLSGTPQPGASPHGVPRTQGIQVWAPARDWDKLQITGVVQATFPARRRNFLRSMVARRCGSLMAPSTSSREGGRTGGYLFGSWEAIGRIGQPRPAASVGRSVLVDGPPALLPKPSVPQYGKPPRSSSRVASPLLVGCRW